jgi:hypothetical protein
MKETPTNLSPLHNPRSPQNFEALQDTDLSPETISEIKDMLFDEYMKQQLIEDFFNDLSEYLDDEHVDAMRGALAEFDDRQIYAAISLPKELRERHFQLFSEKILLGTDPQQVMKSFVALNEKYGFGVGYHTSAADIKPDPATGRWEIVGREHDHRDNDLARAYYSSHYRHLYSPKDHQLYVKKAHPQFIYIVRTEPNHKTDGNWSRASRLSVIARVPYSDVVNYVELTTKRIEGRR